MVLFELPDAWLLRVLAEHASALSALTHIVIQPSTGRDSTLGDTSHALLWTVVNVILNRLEILLQILECSLEVHVSLSFKHDFSLQFEIFLEQKVHPAQSLTHLL